MHTYVSLTGVSSYILNVSGISRFLEGCHSSLAYSVFYLVTYPDSVYRLWKLFSSWNWHIQDTAPKSRPFSGCINLFCQVSAFQGLSAFRFDGRCLSPCGAHDVCVHWVSIPTGLVYPLIQLSVTVQQPWFNNRPCTYGEKRSCIFWPWTPGTVWS